MSATTPSTALATIQPAFTDAERLALAGFLADYRVLTREACTLDLRQFTGWRRARSLPFVLGPPRRHRDLRPRTEARGRARATVTRRLCTVAGSCKYAVEEELLDRSPAAHVRRPRLDYESHATALDRNEFGALLVAAGLGPPASSGGSPAVRGFTSASALTRCAMPSSPLHWMPGCLCGTSRKPHLTPTRGPRCATTGPGPAWTGMRPTSSPPTPPGQLGSRNPDPRPPRPSTQPKCLPDMTTVSDRPDFYTGSHPKFSRRHGQPAPVIPARQPRRRPVSAHGARPHRTPTAP
jgi:hypothetical protein